MADTGRLYLNQYLARLWSIEIDFDNFQWLAGFEGDSSA
jgi:hypothetical protein